MPRRRTAALDLAVFGRVQALFAGRTARRDRTGPGRHPPAAATRSRPAGRPRHRPAARGGAHPLLVVGADHRGAPVARPPADQRRRASRRPCGRTRRRRRPSSTSTSATPRRRADGWRGARRGARRPVGPFPAAGPARHARRGRRGGRGGRRSGPSRRSSSPEPPVTCRPCSTRSATPGTSPPPRATSRRPGIATWSASTGCSGSGWTGSRPPRTPDSATWPSRPAIIGGPGCGSTARSPCGPPETSGPAPRRPWPGSPASTSSRAISRARDAISTPRSPRPSGAAAAASTRGSWSATAA